MLSFGRADRYGVGDAAELHGLESRRAAEARLVDLGPPRIVRSRTRRDGDPVTGLRRRAKPAFSGILAPYEKNRCRYPCPLRPLRGGRRPWRAGAGALDHRRRLGDGRGPARHRGGDGWGRHASGDGGAGPDPEQRRHGPGPEGADGARDRRAGHPHLGCERDATAGSAAAWTPAGAGHRRLRGHEPGPREGQEHRDSRSGARHAGRPGCECPWRHCLLRRRSGAAPHGGADARGRRRAAQGGGLHGRGGREARPHHLHPRRDPRDSAAHGGPHDGELRCAHRAGRAGAGGQRQHHLRSRVMKGVR